MNSGAALLLLALGTACGSREPPSERPTGEAPPPFEPPVVTNPESPVSYPVDLYDQQVEGTVVLHLFVDEHGGLVPESTRVTESSGYAGLDSAAIQGVPKMRFAAARRDGQPVAATFLQPVHFRRSVPPGTTRPP